MLSHAQYSTDRSKLVDSVLQYEPFRLGRRAPAVIVRTRVVRRSAGNGIGHTGWPIREPREGFRFVYEVPIMQDTRIPFRL